MLQPLSSDVTLNARYILIKKFYDKNVSKVKPRVCVCDVEYRVAVDVIFIVIITICQSRISNIYAHIFILFDAFAS